MHHLVYFSEVALTDYVSYLILKLEVLKDSEILEQLKPLFDGCGLLSDGLSPHQVDTSCREDNGFV